MRRRALLLLLVVALLLLSASYFVSKHQVGGTLRFYRYDWDHNRWIVKSWDYFDRPQYRELYDPNARPVDYIYPNFYVVPYDARTGEYLYHNLYDGRLQIGTDYYVSYCDKYVITSTPPYTLSCSTGTGPQGTVVVSFPGYYGSFHYPALASPDFAPVDVLWGAARPRNPPVGVCQDSVYDSWLSLDSLGYELIQPVSYFTFWAGGYGYDYNRGSPFMLVYVHSSCYSPPDPYRGTGLYLFYGTLGDYVNLTALGKDYSFYTTGCGLAAVTDSYDRLHLVVGYDDNYNLLLGPTIPSRYSAWFFFPDRNEYGCVFSDGTVVFSHYRVEHLASPPFETSLGYASAKYPAPLVYDGNKYTVMTSRDDGFAHFYDRDADGIPDFWQLVGTRLYRKEFVPWKVSGIEFNGPAVVPRETNWAVLQFRLAGMWWPGSSVTVQNLGITVDGLPVDTNGISDPLSDYAEYNFTYGDHTICYNFSALNGDDIDSFYNCYDVHISYLPWNLSFTYEQNGTKVLLIGYAEDDGTITRFEWNVDGNTYVTNLAHIELELSPGVHDVCMTVYDDDNNPATICGTIKLYSYTVPGPVEYKPVQTSSVVVTGVPVGPYPQSILLSPLGILLVLAALGVIWWIAA